MFNAYIYIKHRLSISCICSGFNSIFLHALYASFLLLFILKHSTKTQLKSSTNISNKSESLLQATDSNYASVKSSKKSLKISSKISESANSMNNLNELKRPSSSILSSIVSPVGLSYRSKLSKLMKNRLNKSQITLDSRKGNQENNQKVNNNS